MGHLFFAYAFQLALQIPHVIQTEIEFTISNEFGIIFWTISIINIDHDNNFIFYYTNLCDTAPMTKNIA